jgi:hypothetical protein
MSERIDVGEVPERVVATFEKIADALDRLAKIEQQKFDRMFPEKPKHAGTIIRDGDDKREQFSDRPTDQWISETEAATPEGKSRFQERFETAQAGDGDSHAEKERGPVAAENRPKATRTVPKNK